MELTCPECGNQVQVPQGFIPDEESAQLGLHTNAVYSGLDYFKSLGKEPNRNGDVTIRSNATGETREMK
jgi:hypothetical protein